MTMWKSSNLLQSECIVGLALFSQLHLSQAIIGYRSLLYYYCSSRCGDAALCTLQAIFQSLIQT